MNELRPTTSGVLVVEDDRDIRALLADIVRGLGSHPIEVADGAAAMAAYDARRPDAVVLDLQLPVRSGYDVLDHIRRQSGDTPVIVVSATATGPYSLRHGADNYFPKPFDLVDLENTLRFRLRHGRAIAQ